MRATHSERRKGGDYTRRAARRHYACRTDKRGYTRRADRGRYARRADKEWELFTQGGPGALRM